MNDKLLIQEKIINDYKNKINGLDKKLIELKNNENDYKKLSDEIIRKIEEQKNKTNEMNLMKNNINQNFYNMNKFNNNMKMNMQNIGGFPLNHNQNIMSEKKCIIFKSIDGDTTIFNFDLGTTINEILKEYIKRESNSEKINSINDFSFLFNGKRINFEDNTKIEKYFYGCHSPYILVMKK